MSRRFAALEQGPSHKFIVNESPKCPHCGEDFDIRENEAWFLYDENETHEVECADCGDTFRVNASAQWSFSTDEQEAEG